MASTHDDSPGVRFPPPLVYAAALILGLGLSAVYPVPWIPTVASRVLGWVLIAGWLVFALPSVVLFFRRGTTIRPDRSASHLMTSGPYRFTRNPMYVSLTLLYAGVSILWHSVWALLLLPLVVLFIDRRVIRFEEPYLQRRFGADYTRYCARVRRWL